ncbi:MAG: AAA family ATPase [Planctomycetes bacterium]|nr:AAA family ATPase [Planctomycetota bacterium]
MIEQIEFKNFKALRDTTLPLGRFTLIVGPNGSGKSTALQALQAASVPGNYNFDSISTLGGQDAVIVTIKWGSSHENQQLETRWHNPGSGRGIISRSLDQNGAQLGNEPKIQLVRWVDNSRVFSLDPVKIAQPVKLTPGIELAPIGFGLAGVLDHLRDQAPERFESLNEELHRWLPEYDRILFDVPETGQRAFSLRTVSGHQIAATELSHGTLLALAILTIAYLPDPPPLVAFEDPDRGIHPRLLRDVQDALYRLAYPENYGESREPVQVIATTHSPYLLDLYKDHPEEIVIAHKQGSDATFERLSDRADINEILQDASLGEVWFSGILGGVPAET